MLPLFYYRDDDLFAFASEIKALLPALPGPPEVDLASLDSYLSRRAVLAPAHPVPARPQAGGRATGSGCDRDGTTDLDRYWALPDRHAADR